MRTHRTWLVALALPLLMASVLVAQGIPTSTISGHIINEGQGLPGVTVTAKSPALQGTRTAVTSTNGDFVFANVPPGEYTITMTMSGFQTVTRTVKANASQQAVVNATMSLAAVAAEAVVVGTSESISQSTQAATTYTSDLLGKLPTARTLNSSVILTPGLNSSGPNGVTISGAMSTENLYTVNGVVITDNVRSTANNLFIEDAIQETTTTTSSVSAEFGRFTGGVINTITKSGGNTFSGSLRATLTNDSWQAYSAYRTSTGVNPQEGTFVNSVVPTWEATLGGPILKDKLWFFLAGRYYDTSDSLSAVTKYTNIPYTYGNKEPRYEAKLTFSPFQSHTITGSYLGIGTESANYVFPSIPISESKQLYNRQTPQSLLALNYNGVITSNFFVEAQYSNRQFTFQNSGGQSTDLIAGTVIRDLASATSMNAAYFCGVCGEETRDNENLLVKGTYFLSTKGLGSHNLVFGYDNFSGKRNSNNYQSGSNWVFYSYLPSVVQGTSIYPVFAGDGGSMEMDWWPVLEKAQTNDLNTQSVFLNDSWRLNNNFSFNLGLRYDKNHAVDMAGNVTANDDAFSPRLAATWDVKGDGKLAFTASYGRYVAALQDTQAGSGASPAGSPSDFYWYYAGPDINTGSGPYINSNAAIEKVFGWFQSQGCLPDPTSPNCKVPLANARIGGLNVQIKDGLTSPSADEYVFGIRGTIGAKGSYRADVVRREYQNFYDQRKDMSTGQVTDPYGNTSDVALIETSNDYRREYTGLHTQINYRFGTSLNTGANWTWSHLIGDIVGETSGSGPTQGSSHIYPEYIERRWNNPVGSLGSDERHRVRVFATWDTPVPASWGNLSLGFVQSWDTGTPYGAVGSVNSKPYVTNPGYASVNGISKFTYYYTARDAYRTEDIWRTDLSLNYSYRIGGVVEVYVAPIVYNLFNQQALIAPNTTVEDRTTNSSSYAAFNPFTTTPKQGARGTGANWNTGPSFGKATSAASYQSTRTFQISMGVRF